MAALLIRMSIPLEVDFTVAAALTMLVLSLISISIRDRRPSAAPVSFCSAAKASWPRFKSRHPRRT